MARIGVFVGVGDEQNATYAAEKIRSATGFVGDVIRLRDRTGPSVAERVTALEAANADTVSRCGAMFREIGDRTVNMCDKRVTDVEKRLDALESALGEPVCVGCDGTVGQHHAPDGGGCSGWFPTVREHLARIETEHRAAVYRISDMERLPVASPPATTEPTPSGAAEDRLAKVAEPTDDYLGRLARAQANSLGYAAAGRALYNLGREHGRAERAATAQHEAEAWDALRPYNDTRDPEEIGDLVADIGSLVADWQKQREELDTIRAALPSQFKGLDLDTVSAVDLCVGTMSKALNEAAASRKTWRERAILLAERAGRLRADRDVAVQARDVAEAENAALRNRRAADLRLLGRLVHHMYIEGQQGDGIPESAWDDYQKAKALAAAIAELPKDASPARTWEEERADAVAFWTKHIDGHPRDYAALGPVLDQFETGGHIGAAARAKTPEKASDAEPTEAEMARELPKAGPTPEPTEDEMAAELREAGWSEGSGWRSPRDTLFAWHRYTADAYAAMRAAKGAK